MARMSNDFGNFLQQVHEALSKDVQPECHRPHPTVGEDVCAGIACTGRGMIFARATVLGVTTTTRRVFLFDIGSTVFVPASRIWALGHAAAVMSRPTFHPPVSVGSPCGKIKVPTAVPSAVECVIVQSINPNGSCGVTSATINSAYHETLMSSLTLASTYAPSVSAVEVGDFVLALSQPHEDWKVWCRSLIMSCSEDGASVRVEHIDYGCFEDIPRKNIRALPPYLAIDDALAWILRTDMANVTVELNGEYSFSIGDAIGPFGREFLVTPIGLEATMEPGIDEMYEATQTPSNDNEFIEQTIQVETDNDHSSSDVDLTECCETNHGDISASPVDFLLADRGNGYWRRAIVMAVLPSGPLGEPRANLRLLNENDACHSMVRHKKDGAPPMDGFNVLVVAGYLCKEMYVILIRALGPPRNTGTNRDLPVVIRAC